MKLQNAIKKLEKAGYEVQEKMENRNYQAKQAGKDIIEINADSDQEVYAVYYIIEETDEKVFVSSLTQAIKYA